MPGSDHGPSIKNPRVYEALRRKGMSKTRAARISNAQRHKDSGAAGLAIPPHGPNALLNNPGIERRPNRRQRRRLKANPNWGAKRGETIIGGLGRGEGGRFTSSGKPSARQTNSAAQRKRRDELRAKREARAAEQAAAREQELAQEETTRTEEDSYIAAGATGRERQRRRAEIAAKRRERATERRERHRADAANERELRRQEDEDEASAREGEAAQAQAGGGGGGGGKKKPTDEEKRAEQDKKAAANRTATAPKVGLTMADAEALRSAAEGAAQTMAQIRTLETMGLTSDGEATDAGRRALNALERGDVRGALAAIQDGKAQVQRRRQRGDDRRKRDEDKKKREQTRQADQRKRDEERKKRDTDRATEQARRERERQTQEQARAAEQQRLSRESSRTLAAQAIRNMEERRQRRRRKEQRTYGGTKRAELPDSAFAGPDRSFPIKTAQDVRDAVRSLGRTKHDKAAVRRGIIRRARAIGAMDALPEGWRSEKDYPDQRQFAGYTMEDWDDTKPDSFYHATPFTVFKDSAGRDRWAAITTTAYEDKDAEWISCKAIRAVVAAGDTGAPRGVLRFWHVPGLDLGDCDYQAAVDDGRLLLESGTFRSKAAARIGAEAARRGYQMSPGFVHSRREPQGGIFNHIAIFERSFVPPGRASNPYTRLLTKESRMLTKEKRAEFEALAGDDEGRALLQSLLAQAETTTKTAEQAGAVYKDAPAWAQQLISEVQALGTRVKAMEAKAPMPADEMIEAGETELGDGLEEELADDGMGDAVPPSDLLDDDGFADLIVQKLVAAIGPLLELEKKVAGYLNEMKALPALAQQKDDARAQELATLRAANEAFEKRLKELEGGQPRSYRADVWGNLTGVPVTPAQAQAITAKQATEIPAGLNEQEQGAYALIFGEQ